MVEETPESNALARAPPSAILPADALVARLGRRIPTAADDRVALEGLMAFTNRNGIPATEIFSAVEKQVM